jgi:hypothetical protein
MVDVEKELERRELNKPVCMCMSDEPVVIVPL